MSKEKYVKISKHDFSNYLYSYKLMSNSLEDNNVIKSQFNKLSISKRIEIKNAFKEKENVLKEQIKYISESIQEDIYITCIMVNLNIVATEYNIDSATVCMCVDPPCKINEKIIVK